MRKTSNFKNGFNKCAASLAFVAAAAAWPTATRAEDSPAIELINISTLAPPGKTCVSPEQIKEPQDPIQRYVSDIYREATGGIDSSTSVCLNWELDEKDGSGLWMPGLMVFKDNEIHLNPADKFSDAKRVTSIRHEKRHEEQQQIGGFHSLILGGDAPKIERMAMSIILEIDARLDEVMYADEMQRKGNLDYINLLYDSKMTKPMISAFESSMRVDPTDMPAALRAGFRAGLRTRILVDYYKMRAIEIVELNAIPLEPEKAPVHILNDENLMKLGKMGEHNYMNPGFMTEIRNMYAGQDFETLAAMRKKIAIKLLPEPASAVPTAF